MIGAMESTRAAVAEARPLLPPYPTGWYALAMSSELRPGKVHAMTLAGQEIVLFRTHSGDVSAMDAYCPHLGAHMGYGGTVDGECIRCPFHGFRYDVNGNCTFIPNGTKPPPLALVRTLPAREVHGVILAYFDPAGREPGWEIPDFDTEGWTDPLVKSWTFRGHPQETTENSVDFAHFAEVHQYSEVQTLKDATTAGPYLNAKYAMARPAGLFGRPVTAVFEIHVRGLGYSLVEVEVPQYGFEARLYVLATPIDGEQIRLRVALSLRKGIRPSRINPLLAPVPRAIVERLVARAIFAGLVHDVQQDFAIWEHKRYVQPPALAAGDGPVGTYRRWARQFYEQQ